jgi:hypothetical protein
MTRTAEEQRAWEAERKRRRRTQPGTQPGTNVPGGTSDRVPGPQDVPPHVPPHVGLEAWYRAQFPGDPVRAERAFRYALAMPGRGLHEGVDWQRVYAAMTPEQAERAQRRIALRPRA